MKKKIIVLVFVFCHVFVLTAQKEIYISEDSTRTVTLQGISLNATGKKYFTSRISFRTQYDLNYFYETSISKPVTIMLYSGLSYYPIKKYRFNLSGTGASYTTNSDKYNSNYLALNLTIEPRYYFSLNKRTSERRGGLNSGWFIGLPLSVGIIINKPENYFIDENNEVINDNSLVLKNRIKYLGGLNIGYRYAITNKLFTEISSGMQYINNNDYYIDYHFSFNGKILLAYTF